MAIPAFWDKFRTCLILIILLVSSVFVKKKIQKGGGGAFSIFSYKNGAYEQRISIKQVWNSLKILEWPFRDSNFRRGGPIPLNSPLAGVILESVTCFPR